MKNILLIGPSSPQIRTGQYLAPPLGVHRIASYLIKKGVAKVDVIDPNLERDKINTLLKDKQYHIIGHSLLHPTLENDLRLLFQIHKIQPDALKVVGGQGASFNYQEILNKTPAQVVVRGYGEKSLERIVKGENPYSISGLYIKERNQIIPTHLVPRMSLEEFREISLALDFSKIPYPKYWQYMLNQYTQKQIKAMANQGMVRTIRLMTSNYCPMGCTFCSSTNFLDETSAEKQRLLQLPAGDIITLMKNAGKAHLDTEAFYFNDDNFMLDPQRNEEFYSQVQGLEKKYNLMCMGRVDNVTKERLRRMKEAGFKINFYGAETFSNRLAKDIKKTNKDNYNAIATQAVENTLEAGIIPQVSLMLFLPTTKREDLETTIETSIDLMKKGTRITIFPYVEAFAGADIVKDHECSFKEFEIGGKRFKFPSMVLPDDPEIRRVAEDALYLRDYFNKKIGDHVPQPVDSLNLFKAIYVQYRRGVEQIDGLISKFMGVKER